MTSQVQWKNSLSYSLIFIKTVFIYDSYINYLTSKFTPITLICLPGSSFLYQGKKKSFLHLFNYCFLCDLTLPLTTSIQLPLSLVKRLRSARQQIISLGMVCRIHFHSASQRFIYWLLRMSRKVSESEHSYVGNDFWHFILQMLQKEGNDYSIWKLKKKRNNSRQNIFFSYVY